MKFLPREWWRLSLLWLFKKDKESPRGKARLFQNAVAWASTGLALGIGALSVTLAITSGFENSLSKIVAGVQGDLTHYTKWAFSRELDEFSSVAREMKIRPEKIQYFWNSYGLVVGKKGGRGALIEGNFDPDASDRRSDEDDADGNRIPEITIGKPLAEYLGVGVGDQIRLLLPGLIRGAIPAKVVALTSFGMHEIDSRYLSLDDRILKRWLEKNESKSFAERPGDAFGIRYFLGESYRTLAQRNRVIDWMQKYDDAFAKRFPMENPPELLPWWMQRKNLFGSIDLDKNLLTLVLSLLVLVSTLNVAATLVVLFLERDRDIAIVRALGLTRAQLVQWTGLIGFLIGVGASAAGLLVGRLMGWVLVKLPWAELPAQVYRISRLPLDYVVSEQIYVFVFGVAASTFLALALGFVLARKSYIEVLGHRL